MQTAWLWRSFVAVPVGIVGTANLFAAQLDPDKGGIDTFTEMRLSPTGLEPATFIGAVIPGTVAIVAAMDALAASGALPGMMFYRWAFDDQTLTATGSKTAALGAAWGLAASLADMGLQIISSGGPS